MHDASSALLPIKLNGDAQMTQIGRSGLRDGPGDQRGRKPSNGMTSRPSYFAAWDDPLSVHALFRCFQEQDVAPTIEYLSIHFY
jgi:hypothetical protein